MKPRTMSAEQERSAREYGTGVVKSVFAELDAERAVTRELCEALEKALTRGIWPETDDAGRAALAKARGEWGAS